MGALLAQGDLLLSLERPSEALLSFREGADLATHLGESAEPHSTYGSDLAELHDRVATTLLALERRPEALDTWRTALSIIEPLAKKTPENAFWQADLARIWWHLGAALLSSEPDRQEGERALKRALRYLGDLRTAGRLPGYAASWQPHMATGGDASDR